MAQHSIFFLLLSIAVARSLCPFGYTVLFGGKCIKASTDTVPPSLASIACAVDGASELSLHSQQELDTARKYATSNGFYIGLRCNNTATGNKYYWQDGSPVDFLNMQDQQCGPGVYYYVYAQYGKIYSYTGSAADQYFCEIQRKDNPCGPDYILKEDVGTCVKVNTTVVPWQDAEAQCITEAAHLLAIHDAKSNDYFRVLAFGAGISSSVSIGIQIANDNSLTWSDASPVNYSNFQAGMLNSVLGNCGALRIANDPGSWVPTHCDNRAQLPFMCSKLANTTFVSPTCPATQLITADGPIFSPGYPGYYSANLSCEYVFAAADGKRVVLHFTDFEVNACCDKVDLYEGLTSSTPFASLTGSADPSQLYYTKADNVLRVVFTSTSSAKGFQAEITAIL